MFFVVFVDFTRGFSKRDDDDAIKPDDFDDDEKEEKRAFACACVCVCFPPKKKKSL